MQQKIQHFINKHELLNRQETIIVGVSGGADSVVLLHVLLSLGFTCRVAHCNFHLREEESNSDEQFVQELSKSLQIPYHKIDFDTQKHAKEHHISIEMAARNLRYSWFYELLETHHAQAIAVAHHADDSIETLFMNLIRGTGLRGVTGIPCRNEKVVRPLLCCNRSEIEAYLIENGLKHITDASNATLLYLRNKIRNVVLPLLEEINPSVRQTLYENLSHFAGSFAIYEQALKEIKNEVMTFSTDLISIDIEKLKTRIEIPTLLYEMLHPYGFSPSTISQINDQLEGESGKQFFSETHRLIKDRNFLLLSEKKECKQTVFWIDSNDTYLDLPLKMSIASFQNHPEFEFSKLKECVHLDASKLNYPLQLRHWQEGDTFFPLGMNKKKKLSDFFIDNKLSLFEKKEIWLLLSDNEVVWIVGMRVDNRFRIDDQTKKILEIKIGNS